MIKDANSVRRMDLILRSEYIGLETEIYKIGEYQYIIFCKKYMGNFEELSKHFDTSIRVMGFNVKLSTKIPQHYVEKINGISFSNVVDGFKSSCITMPDIETFIIDKFCDVDIINISSPEQGIGFSLLIEVSSDTSDGKIDEMKRYLLDADVGTDSIEITRAPHTESGKREVPYKHPLISMLNATQLGIDKALPFTILESDFWFENAEDIYVGKRCRSEFNMYNDGLTKCLVDYAFHDNVNLRNLILLFDVIYILPPFDDSFDVFLQRQNMSLNDFLELIDAGKVVLLLTNTESRYSKSLLLEAYDNNKSSIIARRGVGAFVASYIVESKQKYLSNFPHAFEIACKLFEYGVMENNNELQKMAKVMAWPITASVDSFKVLNLHGPIAYGDFGFEDIITTSSNLSKEQVENLSLRAMYEHPYVLISAALNATYFPSYIVEKDKITHTTGLGNIFSDFLKMYWYNATELNSLDRIAEQNMAEKQMLSLFNCKENISISKIVSLADEYNTQKRFRDILSRLGNLSDVDRSASIKQYNDVLFDLTSTKAPMNKLDFVLSAGSFLPLNYVATLVLSLVGIIKGRLSTSEKIEKRSEYKIIQKCIENMKIDTNESVIHDIYVLDKISRVAHLR